MLKEKVSVAVITYNSAETVLETLNSIVSQTYGAENIELIVSDDASTDTTVATIDTWLSEHQKTFASTLFIKNAINGGISKNYNLAMKAATCKWIKPIAGDDILLETCLDLNFEFVTGIPDAQVVLSSANLFVRHNDKNATIRVSPYGKFETKPYTLSTQKQYKWLLYRGNFGLAPSMFIKKSALEKIGYADERIPQIEDYPMYIKLTQAGIHLYFLSSITVNYRVRLPEKETFLSNRARNESLYLIHLKIIAPYRGIFFLLLIKTAYFCTNLLILLTLNKRNCFTRIMLKLVQSINPLFFKTIISLIYQRLLFFANKPPSSKDYDH